MNKQEAARIVAVLVASFPSTSSRLTEQRMLSMVDVFAEVLGDLPYREVNAAVSVLVATSKFMPSVAEIREVAFSLRNGKRKTGAEAWGTVVRAMREQGAYRIPGQDFTFADELTHRCVMAMGWNYLCTSENTVADRARWIELYDSIAVDVHQRQLSPTLDAARQQLEAKNQNRTEPAGDAQALVASLAKRLTGGES